MKKLDMRGVAHDVLIVAFVVIFAVSGVAYIVGSHADSMTATMAATAPASSAPKIIPDSTYLQNTLVGFDGRSVTAYACKYTVSNTVWNVVNLFQVNNSSNTSALAANSLKVTVTNNTTSPTSHTSVSKYVPAGAAPQQVLVSLRVNQDTNNYVSYSVNEPKSRDKSLRALNDVLIPGSSIRPGALGTCPNSPVLAPPTSLSISKIKATSATLRWSKGTGGGYTIKSYNILIQGHSPNVGSGVANILTAPKSPYNLTNLVSGTTYTVQVQTTNFKDTNSAISKSLTFTTK